MEDDPNFCSLQTRVAKSEQKTIKDIEIYKKEHHSSFDSEDFRDIVYRVTIKSALEAWINNQKNNETLRKYKSTIEKLFPALIYINLDSSIRCLDKQDTLGVYGLIKEADFPKTTKQMQLSAYSQFCDFVRVITYGLIDPEIGLREQASFYKAKNMYPHIDWELFFKTLEAPYNLICRMVFLASASYQYRLRISSGSSGKNILDLDLNQIDFEKNKISFRAYQSYHTTGQLIEFAPEFILELKEYSKGKEGAVFVPARARKLFPRQVERAIIKAMYKLNIHHQITPVILSWVGVIKNKLNAEEIFKESNPQYYC